MAQISYDGQSFSLDGRRIWLVSGAMHYPRIPRGLWRSRIRAAKEAGLNCIETYVFWNAHEPEPKRYDFEGNLDLRRFIEMIGEEGMFAIVRPGPFVCAEWDFGGLPPWLLRMRNPKNKRLVDVKLRESDPYFLEATARYFGAVMEQIKDLQVTVAPPNNQRVPEGNAPGAVANGYHPAQGGGPIVLMQAENEWFCSNPDEADGYLRETVRYLRENGCTVPIINCNNLFQRMDGTIDTWNASYLLPPTMRQLAVVQPEAPRLVTEYWSGWFDQWGGPHVKTVSPELNLYRLAGILAVGAQYNVYMFHGGTNFGFRGGRTVNGLDCFMTTSYDYDAPLLEAGGRGEKYHSTRRISTFASQFAPLFAHLEPVQDQAVAAPTQSDHPLSIIHQRGSQGEVVFLLKSEKDKTKLVDVLLPDGLTLPVPIGNERAAWFVCKLNLQGVAELTYTNLCPWAFVDRRMLVLFGPAGATGHVCIDDTPIQITVPNGKRPQVETHGEITIVVLSRELVDAAYLYDGGLAVGCDGLNDEGVPRPLAGFPSMTLVAPDGTVQQPKASVPRTPSPPRFGAWTTAPLDDMLDGSADAYRKIDGPLSHERLECDYGYGWYRLKLSAPVSGKVLAPESGDRLHVYNDGKLQEILGIGDGASYDPVQLRLAKTNVVLSDNLGRYNYGQHLGETKGLFGHVLAVKSLRVAKPEITTGRGPDPFELAELVLHRRKGERPIADALTWIIKPAGRKPVVMEIGEFPGEGMILINDEPFALYANPAKRFVFKPGEGGFTGGKNRVTFALYEKLPDNADSMDHVRFYQATSVVTEKADWAFAPFALPAEDVFIDLPARTPVQPTWYRTSFTVKDVSVPLWLEPRGMSKGQIYLNGHNVGRYYVATRTGKVIGPQTRYYLPEPWLDTEGLNDLLIFDEHGKNPGKCRLKYDPTGPYN